MERKGQKEKRNYAKKFSALLCLLFFIIVRPVVHGQALLQELQAVLVVHREAALYEVCFAIILEELPQVIEQLGNSCSHPWDSALPLSWSIIRCEEVCGGEERGIASARQCAGQSQLCLSKEL